MSRLTLKLNNSEYWQVFASEIQQKIKWHFDIGINDQKISHLSVFAIGPMPLLMFLGKCIGDTVPADLYQRHRNIADTNNNWTWSKEEQKTETPYITNFVRVNDNHKNIAIVLSLSGKIHSDRYENLATEEFSVYEITIGNPTPHFLKFREQLEGFIRECRQLLNNIQSVHGDSCKVYIIPAVPAPIAVECGRVFLPKSDPEIFGCEYDDKNRLRVVLKINSRE